MLLPPYVCNWCHDVIVMSMNFSDIAILNIHGVAYHCTNNRISKSEAMSLLKKYKFKCGDFHPNSDVDRLCI